MWQVNIQWETSEMWLKINHTHRRGRFWRDVCLCFVLFEPKAGTVRLTETLVVCLLLVCLLVNWLLSYRGFSRDYIDIPYLCQDSVACLCHLHSLHNPWLSYLALLHSLLTQPPQSLVFLSRDTTQPPHAKVWTSTASTFLGFPYLVWLHSLHGPRSGLTQPPQTKVLVGPCDFKFKIGDNPGL